MDSCFKEEAIGAVGGVGLSSLTASSSQPQYLVCFKKQISVRCEEKKEKKNATAAKSLERCEPKSLLSLYKDITVR